MNLTTYLIWAAIIVVVFAIAWWQGYVAKFRNYWNATVEELKKCSWPTWDELKGSTVVVTIAIALLGAFTFLVDYVFYHVVLWITKV